MSLEIKKKIKRLNFCLLKNFETKMTNLTLSSSSVGGGWGRTAMHIYMTGMLVGKLEFKNPCYGEHHGHSSGQAPALFSDSLRSLSQ